MLRKLLVAGLIGGVTFVFSIPSVVMCSSLPDIIPYQTEDNNSQYIPKMESNYDEDDFFLSRSDNPVFVFTSSDLSGKPIATLRYGYSGYILGEASHVLLVTSGGFTGYISDKDIIIGKEAVSYAAEHLHKTICAATSMAYVYDSPSIDGSVINICTIDEPLSVLDEKGDFYKVKGDTFSAGYISKGDVYSGIEKIPAETCDMSEYDKLYPQISPEECSLDGLSLDTGSVTSLQQSIVIYALQFLGNPYKWGGTDLDKGIDCSGFTQQIYKNFGFSLPRTSSEQRDAGVNVCMGFDKSLVQPGDLVCYDGHIALYIGDGMVISASNEKNGIRMTNAQYRDVICVRRIIFSKSADVSLSDSEYNLFCRVVEAEAAGEGITGKILVANVIMNRVYSSAFPDTICDVVYQHDGDNYQFQSVENGKYGAVRVSDETRLAVNMALSSEDNSQGALYFFNRRYSDAENVDWFDRELTFLFEYGGHEFFK